MTLSPPPPQVPPPPANPPPAPHPAPRFSFFYFKLKYIF